MREALLSVGAPLIAIFDLLRLRERWDFWRLIRCVTTNFLWLKFSVGWT